MAPADNERRRRATAKLFATMLPSVATRLRWIEEDAAGFVRLLEGGQKTGIADMRRWAKRAQFVCHTVLAEPAPPSLGRLVDLFVGAKDGQVCETQSSLPCFPSTSAALPPEEP
jgi:hypothetical protein